MIINKSPYFEYIIIGDVMKKSIKINFILPTDEKNKEILNARINKFNREVWLTYINNLNCNYEEKIKILNIFSL